MTQAYNLSQLANNLNTSGQLDATDGLVNAVPILNGGTGVNNATALTLLIGNVAFPIGSIYSATVATNPATLLGFGTWTAFGAGRVLIGNGGGFTAGATGGSADATLPTHTHTFSGTTSAIGNHQHESGVGTYGTFGTGGTYNRGQYGGSGNGTVDLTNNAGAHDHTYSGTTAATGVSPTNANLQPYIVVYMWTRTA
jgi:hypothetical protein